MRMNHCAETKTNTRTNDDAGFWICLK